MEVKPVCLALKSMAVTLMTRPTKTCVLLVRIWNTTCSLEKTDVTQ